MSADQLLYLASIIVFTFGALTFSVLTVVYWRERRSRRQAGSDTVLPTFTLVCGAAFLTNILLQTASALDLESGWASGLAAIGDTAASLLPPMMFHLVFAGERRHVPRPRLWRTILVTLYAGSIAGAAGQWLDDQDLLFTNWSGAFLKLPAVIFGLAGALGLAVQFLSTRDLKPATRRHRFSIRILLALTVLCALWKLAGGRAYPALLPDYLVLAFFCVTLYYQERLIFFDFLVKRGTFFALALLGLSLFFFVEGRLPAPVRLSWGWPWIGALVLTPFWLAAPWVSERVGTAIDRMWLKRRYSPADAERRFTHAIHAASTEEELRTSAENSLRDVFQSSARVELEAKVETAADGLAAPLGDRREPVGWIRVAERPDSIPFLSDDRRLLQSLARTLSVVLENVRFRQQQLRHREREQHLSRLAARSELRALRAQINPHFLFNSLNAIAGLIPEQPRAAEQTVEQLAEVFRYALRKSEKEWVRLDEEVEFVLSCVGVEQARFGDRLEVNVAIDGLAGDVPVPAMSIQPLVENAIKHGASMVEGRGKVALRAVLDAGNLRVEVEDNGPGFPASFRLGDDSPGYGLRNIADRLKGYYGDTAGLKWERSGGNTRVTLLIPCADRRTAAETCR